MSNDLLDYEYLYIKCVRCDDRVKMARNLNGGYWETYNPAWLTEFLMAHAGCGDVGTIVLEATND